jgi:hypothetical protein
VKGSSLAIYGGGRRMEPKWDPRRAVQPRAGQAEIHHSFAQEHDCRCRDELCCTTVLSGLLDGIPYAVRSPYRAQPWRAVGVQSADPETCPRCT